MVPELVRTVCARRCDTISMQHTTPPCQVRHASKVQHASCSMQRLTLRPVRLRRTFQGARLAHWLEATEGAHRIAVRRPGRPCGS
jgi:hypothetical protein